MFKHYSGCVQRHSVPVCLAYCQLKKITTKPTCTWYILLVLIWLSCLVCLVILSSSSPSPSSSSSSSSAAADAAAAAAASHLSRKCISLSQSWDYAHLALIYVKFFCGVLLFCFRFNFIFCFNIFSWCTEQQHQHHQHTDTAILWEGGGGG